MFAIEKKMSTQERSIESSRYWTTIDGERYLQVEEVDNECFRDKEKSEVEIKENNNA